ncbi:hypothetical protein PGT21_012932 [Puccinia graminis f. sp. tritici]|uniref:Uncharacterized protein n=1 Tax=Puccinia graminis f. sp. tritici TaxID=56615 RepID=A0A5B0PHY8_PUCGR|nr:hypothetical protein PGT21_012932 [Puccinia graminis f. sp. tritici]
MNLPTYSLADSPHSTILNVCLGVPPSSKPIIINRPPPKPSSSSSLSSSSSSSSSKVFISQQNKKSDLKGKAPQRDQNEQQEEVEEEEEEQWQDAEFRRSSTRQPTSLPPSDQDLLNNSHIHNEKGSGENEDHPLFKYTGWDECFATANAEGWTIYRNYPLRVIQKHVVPNGSLRIVMPLHRTNILYLVGGPPSALYSPNKVIIYDSLESKAKYSIEMSSPVLGITARRDKLVVVLLERVVLFGVSPEGVMYEEGEWETCKNPKGLVCLGSAVGSSLLVFPGRQSGKVQIVHLPLFEPDRPASSSSSGRISDRTSADRRQHPPYPSTAILVAHTTPLASLAITPCGKLIATASVTGTLIRIWNAKSAALVRELRRGTDGAEIWGLRFRPDGLAICATSDKGTIHVWSLAEKPKTKEPNEDGKTGRSLALLKPYLPKYFHSTWSDGFFRLPGPGGKPSRGTSLPGLFGSPVIGGASSGESSGGGEGIEGGIAHGRPLMTVEDDVSLVSWILAPGPGPEPSPPIEPQIVAITRSGAWFRLRMPPSTLDLLHPPPPNTTSSSSSAAASGKSPSVDRSVPLECVEYRRFLEDEDWSDEDDQDCIGRFPS